MRENVKASERENVKANEREDKKESGRKGFGSSDRWPRQDLTTLLSAG